MTSSLVLPDLRDLMRAAAGSAQSFAAQAKAPVKAKIAKPDGRVDRVLADKEQHAVHGYGWYATYAEVLTQVSAWADRLEAEGQFGETEALLAQLLFAEYGAQLIGGIAMNPGEVLHPADLDVTPDVLQALFSPSVVTRVH